MHQRAEIRAKVNEMLIGQTMAGSRGFASRRIPPDQEELPAYLVFTGTEQVTPFDTSLDKRELDVMIECIVRRDVRDLESDIDIKLDTFSNQVEYVFLQDPQLGKLADTMQLESSEPGVDENDPDIQAIVLKYKVTYYTSNTVDDSSTPFLTAGVNMGGDSQEVKLPQ